MTLEFEASERLQDAAEEWAEQRMEDPEEALETKAEQALLEVENLVAGAHEVDFEVDGETIRHDPSDELRALLDEQTRGTDLTPDELLAKHADLFATVFLDNYGDEQGRPSNAPPVE